MTNVSLLNISNFTVHLPPGADRASAVSGVTLSVRSNEILCIVGESGSGKSVLARSVMRLLPEDKLKPGGGELLFEGRDILRTSPDEMRQLRGSRISMIFQEPMTALNPLMRIGLQIEEVLQLHTKLGKAERRELISAKLQTVGLAEPLRVMMAYPHELSGGQRQRAMIAMALLLDPALLIADEPTTALDVTTQAKILKLIRDTQRRSRMGVIFITHDFGVVAEIADRVAVMEKGVLVEIGNVQDVLENPQHPYTRALIAAVPKMRFYPAATLATNAPVVLEVERLRKSYRKTSRSGKTVDALKDVSLRIRRGETVAIVGESGSGKSTLAKCIARLVEVDAGTITLEGVDLLRLSRSSLRVMRSKFQMVFQDPFGSLDPRWRVGNLIAEGMLAHGVSEVDADRRTRELLELVGLSANVRDRFPHEFSGGQRQRIAIARALALKPSLLIADEAVSALDVSVQAQILRLLADIKLRLNLAMLFITHDLRVASQVCDYVCVMREGVIVEHGRGDQVFLNPKHPYTMELVDAVPGIERERRELDLAPGKCAREDLTVLGSTVMPR